MRVMIILFVLGKLQNIRVILKIIQLLCENLTIEF